MPYVRLKSIKNISVHGQRRVFHPGDTVEVGRRTAEQWILDGSAEDPYGQVGPSVYETVGLGSFGIVIRAEQGSVSENELPDLEVVYGEPQLPFEYTFIWDPTLQLKIQLLNYGWLRISEENQPRERWEMAAGLISLEKTAADVGSERDREQTERLIGDLRLPVYESRQLWVRKTEDSEKVISDFAKHLEHGVTEYHAFLRALYKNRCMLCTLPFDWTSR